MNYLRIIILALLISLSSPIFCSSHCKLNSCFGQASNQCTACELPFLLTSGQCLLDPTADYISLAGTSDIDYNLDGITTYCGSYTYYGPKYSSGSGRLRYTHPSVLPPHYCVRLIMWVILVDNWNTVLDEIYVQNVDNGALVSYSVSNRAPPVSDLCVFSSLDTYMRLDVEVPHTGSNSVDLRITSYDSNNQEWGFKEYFMLIGLCHQNCLQCTGANYTQCSQCAAGLWLSGSTCTDACLEGYGISNTPFLCVLCSVYCTECTGVFNNCSSCQTSGIYQSYLYGSSCIISCPNGYVENVTDHVCQPCDDVTNCITCSFPDVSICHQCASGIFWLDFACVTVCPDGMFPTAPNCTSCDNSCSLCTGVPGPCSACTDDYFMHINVCLDTCPVGYFPNTKYQQCRLCATHCVTATLTLQMSSSGQELIATMTFSQAISFSSIPSLQTFLQFSIDHKTVTIEERFKTEVEIINQTTFTMTLIPTMTMFLENVDFSVNVAPQTQNHTSTEANYFSEDIYFLSATLPWTVIILPQMKEEDRAVIERVERMNDATNLLLGRKWVQEIKKSGVFGFLFPGAQLCSTVVLCNTVPAQNMYEGARFWASFIYFQVPQWEQNGNLTKYVGWKNSLDLIEPSNGRLLQYSSSKNTAYCRLARTGHSSYFIIDTYVQCALILICWILVLIMKCVDKKFSKMHTNRKSILFNLVHMVHEVSLFYIGMSAILEIVAFSEQEKVAVSYLSLGLTIIAMLYFVAYNTLIFYRLIPFSFLDWHSHKYKRFVEKFSYFLRDLRYDEYRPKSEWQLCHFFRPYNYRIVGYVRLVLIVACLPLFQDFSYGCISCLLTIQLLEMIRFFLTWPFHSLWRNIVRIVQEFMLFLIFGVYLYLDIYVRSIYIDLNAVTQSQIDFYYFFGWIGFALIFAYNLLYILLFIIDFLIGCRKTNEQRVSLSRRQFYHGLFTELEEKQGLLTKRSEPRNDGCYMKCIRSLQGSTSAHSFRENSRRQIKSLIKKGNLDDEEFDGLKKVRIMIEEFIGRKTNHSNEFQVIVQKIPAVFMRPQVNHKRVNNLLLPQKSLKTFIINEKDPSTRTYYSFFDQLFEQYGYFTVESITIRTFLVVDQNMYKPCQEVGVRKEAIYQEIEIMNQVGGRERFKMREVMEGFPIPVQLVEMIPAG